MQDFNNDSKRNFDTPLPLDCLTDLTFVNDMSHVLNNV